MSGMRTVMADLRAAIEAVPTRHVLPPQGRRATFVAMMKITGGLGAAPAAPTADRLDAAWRSATAHCGAGGDPATLPADILRDIVWLLWDRRRTAASLPGMLKAVQARAERSTLFLRRYIEVWLRDFDPALPDLPAAGRWIAAAVARSVHPGHLQWRRAQETFRLFDVAEGPMSLARALIAGPGPTLLEELGFDTPQRAASGYMRAVLAQFGRELPRHLRGPDAAAVLEAAKRLYVPDCAQRFDEPRMRGEMADAFVGAWIGGQGPDKLRDQVLELLRTHLGDLRTQPARWADTSDDTRRIVRSWLARITLAAFFDVIGRHADASGHAHHWQARRKFWSACLQKDWISDSWLVLGENVRRNVSLDRELRGNFGTLVDSRVNHSALLIRIGQTVFVEWSHNAKLYAWPADGPTAPRFARTGTYSHRELTSPGLPFPPPSGRPDLTISAANGLTHHPNVWQGRVAALLRQREALRLEPRDWA